MSDSQKGPESGPRPGQDFVVRIVSIDYYMAHPVPGLDVCYSELEGTTIESVPIIRVFGATPGGQKACAHVHGVWHDLPHILSLDACIPGKHNSTSRKYSH